MLAKCRFGVRNQWCIAVRLWCTGQCRDQHEFEYRCNADERNDGGMWFVDIGLCLVFEVKAIQPSMTMLKDILIEVI